MGVSGLRPTAASVGAAAELFREGCRVHPADWNRTSLSQLLDDQVHESEWVARECRGAHEGAQGFDCCGTIHPRARALN